MSRKPGARTINPPPPFDDSEIENETAKTDPLSGLDCRPVEDEIAEWVAINQIDGEEIRVYLYRVDLKDRRRSWFLKKYLDQIPDLEEIARDFGPGSYKMAATTKAGGTHRASSWLCHIDPQAVPTSAQGAQGAPAGLVQYANPAAQMAPLFGMFAELVKTMQSAQAAPVAAQGAGAIADQYRIIHELLGNQARENMKMLSALQKKYIEREDEADEIDQGGPEYQAPPPPGPLEQWLPLIQKFLPLILGKGPQSGIAVDAIKALPEYQGLIANQEKLSLAVQALTAELGPIKAKKVLEKLGLQAQ